MYGEELYIYMLTGFLCVILMKYLKAFSNRYELKYVIDWPTYYKIKREIEPLFKRDPSAGTRGNYVVMSTYYDTPDHAFFWQKIDGEEQRIKIRLRTYLHTSESDGKKKNDLFLEIKKKRNQTVFKSRVLLQEQFMDTFLTHPITEHVIKQPDPKGMETLQEVIALQKMLRLKPTLLISYTREPFVSRDNFHVRITFDSNIRYRHRDLSLIPHPGDKHVLSPNNIVMEIKYTTYFPQWLVQIIQRNNCEAVRFSKYGNGMEHFLKEQKILSSRRE